MKSNLFILIFSIVFIYSCSNDENSSSNETAPSSSINTIENIGVDSVLAIASLISSGDFQIENHGFVFSISNEPTINDNLVSLGPIDGVQEFQSTIDNLSSNTTYFIRAFLSYNSGETVYSNQLTFSTLEEEEEEVTWNELPSLIGSYLVESSSFKINNSIYVGMGIKDGVVNNFYKYDYDLGTWSEISSLPSEPRSDGIGFSIGNFGYFGFGRSPVPGSTIGETVRYKDLWRYDPVTDSWSEMSQFPDQARSNSTSFVINDKAYITGGRNNGFNNLWEYNPTSNSWLQKSSYPGGCSSDKISFVINNKAYLGLGFQNGNCNDIWEYDPINDSWEQKSDFNGEARHSAISVSLNGYGFIGMGFSADSQPFNYYSNFWKYDALNDEWSMLNEDYQGQGRLGMFAETVNNSIILGLGGEVFSHVPSQRHSDIWEFNPFISD